MTSTPYSTIGGQTQPPPTQFPIAPLPQQNAHLQPPLHRQPLQYSPSPLHPQQVQLLSGSQPPVSGVPPPSASPSLMAAAGPPLPPATSITAASVPAATANQDTIFCSSSSSSCSSSSCSNSTLPSSAKLHSKPSTSTLPLGQQWDEVCLRRRRGIPLMYILYRKDTSSKWLRVCGYGGV